jgi:hypothetical protein
MALHFAGIAIASPRLTLPLDVFGADYGLEDVAL